MRKVYRNILVTFPQWSTRVSLGWSHLQLSRLEVELIVGLTSILAYFGVGLLKSGMASSFLISIPMEIQRRQKKKSDNHKHRAHVTLMFRESNDLVTTHLSSSVASFSWVWQTHGVTLVIFTAVGLGRTTGYGLFHIGSRVGFLFTHTNLLGKNLWLSSDTIAQPLEASFELSSESIAGPLRT